MFTYDSFGRRIRVKARAMRRNPNPGDPNTPPPGAPAPTDPPAPGAPTTPPPADLGFPADTPVAQMTAEQQAAYWRHQSQRWEGRAKERVDYDEIKAERDRLAAANLTDEQRAAQEAIEEARRDGENIGAERYLSDAVRAHFQRITGLDDENTTTALQHVQAQSFTDQQGAIDMTALQKFAATFGTGAGANGAGGGDPIADAARRQHQAGGGGGAPSIAEATRQRAEELRGAAK